MLGLNEEEVKFLKQFNTPQKIQDLLDEIPINFEEEGDTCISPREVLRQNRAHCIEGAVLAAVIMRLNGKPGLLIDLESSEDDFDHVITAFKEGGKWGAISKTNHVVLRYREPIYNTPRELVMSYFHEYFDDNGKKNLRKYTHPINIKIFDHKKNWASKKNIWFIAQYLLDAKHYSIISEEQIKKLRKADPIEIKVGKIIEWTREKAEKKRLKSTKTEGTKK